MIKSQLYPYIEKYFQEYLFGFSQEQFDIGVMNGLLNFNKLNLRPDKINKIFDEKNISVWLKAGFISKIVIECSLMNFIGEKPINATIECLNLIISPSLKHIISNSYSYPSSSNNNNKNLNDVFNEDEFNKNKELSIEDTEEYNEKMNNHKSVLSDKLKLFDTTFCEEFFTNSKGGNNISNIKKVDKESLLNYYTDFVLTKIKDLFNKQTFFLNLTIKNINIIFENDLFCYSCDLIKYHIYIKEFSINLNGESKLKKYKCSIEDLNLVTKVSNKKKNINKYASNKTMDINKDNLVLIPSSYFINQLNEKNEISGLKYYKKITFLIENLAKPEILTNESTNGNNDNHVNDLESKRKMSSGYLSYYSCSNPNFDIKEFIMLKNFSSTINFSMERDFSNGGSGKANNELDFSLFNNQGLKHIIHSINMFTNKIDLSFSIEVIKSLMEIKHYSTYFKFIDYLQDFKPLLKPKNDLISSIRDKIKYRRINRNSNYNENNNNNNSINKEVIDNDILDIAELSNDYSYSIELNNKIKQDYKGNDLINHLNSKELKNKLLNKALQKKAYIVRDWWHYLIWSFRMYKSMITFPFKNTVEAEFTRYTSICLFEYNEKMLISNSEKDNESNNKSETIDYESIVSLFKFETQIKALEVKFLYNFNNNTKDSIDNYYFSSKNDTVILSLDKGIKFKLSLNEVSGLLESIITIETIKINFDEDNIDYYTEIANINDDKAKVSSNKNNNIRKSYFESTLSKTDNKSLLDEVHDKRSRSVLYQEFGDLSDLDKSTDKSQNKMNIKSRNESKSPITSNNQNYNNKNKEPRNLKQRSVQIVDVDKKLSNANYAYKTKAAVNTENKEKLQQDGIISPICFLQISKISKYAGELEDNNINNKKQEKHEDTKRNNAVIISFSRKIMNNNNNGEICKDYNDNKSIPTYYNKLFFFINKITMNITDLYFSNITQIFENISKTILVSNKDKEILNANNIGSTSNSSTQSLLFFGNILDPYIEELNQFYYVVEDKIKQGKIPKHIKTNNSNLIKAYYLYLKEIIRKINSLSSKLNRNKASEKDRISKIKDMKSKMNDINSLIDYNTFERLAYYVNNGYYKIENQIVEFDVNNSITKINYYSKSNHTKQNNNKYNNEVLCSLKRRNNGFSLVYYPKPSDIYKYISNKNGSFIDASDNLFLFSNSIYKIIKNIIGIIKNSSNGKSYSDSDDEDCLIKKNEINYPIFICSCTDFVFKSSNFSELLKVVFELIGKFLNKVSKGINKLDKDNKDRKINDIISNQNKESKENNAGINNANNNVKHDFSNSLHNDLFSSSSIPTLSVNSPLLANKYKRKNNASKVIYENNENNYDNTSKSINISTAKPDFVQHSDSPFKLNNLKKELNTEEININKVIQDKNNISLSSLGLNGEKEVNINNKDNDNNKDIDYKYCAELHKNNDFNDNNSNSRISEGNLKEYNTISDKIKSVNNESNKPENINDNDNDAISIRSEEIKNPNNNSIVKEDIKKSKDCLTDEDRTIKDKFNNYDSLSIRLETLNAYNNTSNAKINEGLNLQNDKCSLNEDNEKSSCKLKSFYEDGKINSNSQVNKNNNNESNNEDSHSYSNSKSNNGGDLSILSIVEDKEIKELSVNAVFDILNFNFSNNKNDSVKNKTNWELDEINNTISNKTHSEYNSKEEKNVLNESSSMKSLNENIKNTDITINNKINNNVNVKANLLSVNNNELNLKNKENSSKKSNLYLHKNETIIEEKEFKSYSSEESRRKKNIIYNDKQHKLINNNDTKDIKDYLVSNINKPIYVDKKEFSFSEDGKINTNEKNINTNDYNKPNQHEPNNNNNINIININSNVNNNITNNYNIHIDTSTNLKSKFNDLVSQIRNSKITMKLPGSKDTTKTNQSEISPFSNNTNTSNISNKNHNDNVINDIKRDKRETHLSVFLNTDSNKDINSFNNEITNNKFKLKITQSNNKNKIDDKSVSSNKNSYTNHNDFSLSNNKIKQDSPKSKDIHIGIAVKPQQAKKIEIVDDELDDIDNLIYDTEEN